MPVLLDSSILLSIPSLPTTTTLLSIPSPSSNRIGPFTAYGLMIAIGVIAGVWLARRRWAERGGDPEDITTIALWAVPAGLIGARLYHVITDNQKYRGHWFDSPFSEGGSSPLALWNGGLGIPGGIALGVGVGVFVGHRKGLRLLPGLDAVAPSLPLAQAIGRFGNYFNQELYGRPTDLPWGLQIDCRVRNNTAYQCTEFAPETTFHPTFLYEMLWNLALVALLLWLDKKRVLRPGRIFVLYIGGYFLGRLWVEALRSDDANTILGLRVNIWISLLAVIAVLGVFVIGGVKRRSDDIDEPYRDGRRYTDGVLTTGPGGTAIDAATVTDIDPSADKAVTDEEASAASRDPKEPPETPSGGQTDPSDASEGASPKENL